MASKTSPFPAAIATFVAVAAACGDASSDGGRDAAVADAAGRDSTPRDAAADATVGAFDASDDAADGAAGVPDGAVGAADATAAPVDGGFAGGVLDVHILAADTCDIVTVPVSITVPLGTEFTVNWINVPDSEVEVDVDKIDRFNEVPILIGLAPGESYHDDIREWCGTLFTGTFRFRITSCFEPHFIDVDCGG
jgi:hypothetical protein